MADTDISRQLRRLGVGRGPQELKPRAPGKRAGIESLLPGEVVQSGSGPFFLLRETFELDYRHGLQTLGDLLAHAPELPAHLARDERLAGVDLGRLAFIDTETTGLAGGTGTYAFLVGVGVFEDGRFTIHQFFMRDYGEEAALLHALGGLLDRLEAVVSFNGKSFDMPLLETRFILGRQEPRLIDAPHLDLLSTSRRLWKYRLESCALGSLEAEILGVQRTQADVPGWLIPSLYMEYARTGDAREMPGIFYHNAQDILSLVTLMARQCDLLATALPPDGRIPGEDLYGLARLLDDLGQPDRAEAAFLQSAQSCQVVQVREWARRDLAYLLKRQERRQEALPWWQALAQEDGAVYACEELAKHYEWHEEYLPAALDWTRQGIALVGGWPRGIRRTEAQDALHHRRERLERKMNSEWTRTRCP